MRVVGTNLGLLHFAISPILFLLAYAYIFSSVFTARWAGDENAFGSFALRIYVGLIVFQFFAEVVTRSPLLVLENPSYVRRIIFPLEILTPTAIGVALFAATFSMVVFVAACLVLRGLFPPSSVAALLFWPPLIMLVAGLSWLLSALGVFFRDLNQFVVTLTPMVLFFSPIFYPLSAVPKQLRVVLLFNPLTYLVEGMRAAVFEGHWPDPIPLVILYALGGLCAWAGFTFFRRAKGAFADVM